MCSYSYQTWSFTLVVFLPARKGNGELLMINCSALALDCQHRFTPTLGQILDQPDWSRMDYEDVYYDATIRCPYHDYSIPGDRVNKTHIASDQGIYITDMCTGRFTIDSTHKALPHGLNENCCMGGDYRRNHCYSCSPRYTFMNITKRIFTALFIPPEITIVLDPGSNV